MSFHSFAEIKENLCPLSFTDVSRDDYTAALLTLYEKNNTEPMLELYAWAYIRSCEQYGVVKKSLGEVDVFRIQHRPTKRSHGSGRSLPKHDVMTPEGVLDRMCDSVIQKDTVAFMDDVQLFWRKQWDLSLVPDPREKNALKACFLERMAEVWSEPPKSHSTHAPDWCRRVPPVQKDFSVISDEYREFYEGDLVSPIFSKRNIFAPRDFMFFV